MEGLSDNCGQPFFYFCFRVE